MVKRLVLDVETKVTHKSFVDRNGKEHKWIDGSAYEPDNYLVSVGVCLDPMKAPDETEYLRFQHNEGDESKKSFPKLQAMLDDTTLLVCHNAKYDLGWLLECGFKYDGPVYCTQVAEYVMQKGIKKPLKLEALAEYWNLPRKRTDLTAELWDSGVGYEAMPWSVVEEYGRGDCVTTAHLFQTQQKRLKKMPHLVPTVKMMCEFLKDVLDMERVGVKIDMDALQDIKTEYMAELAQLDIDLDALIQGVMGDTPINLDSPDFRSKLLYSRAVKNKKVWKEKFNLGKDKFGKDLFRPPYTKKQFAAVIKKNTEIVSRTEAKHCDTCDGKGYIFTLTKAGKPYKTMPRCSKCEDGVIYEPTGVVAGFKVIPRGVHDVAAAGFSTNKDDLGSLPDANVPSAAREFIEKFSRRSAVTTYLSTYVEGIERHVYADGILHTHINQTIAATGRLSSTGPNLHNQPRGATFPIRRVFVSRFDGGEVLDGDYGQLEFRAAGFLSGCERALQDINAGVDVHELTKDIINGFDPELPPITRQDAKEHTFKPLYGGSSGTPREKSYYEAFIKKYRGIAEWHETLKKGAISNGEVVIPSGRTYAFPTAKRLASGYVSGTTQIVNYPVQGFATGDLVPLGIISVRRLLRSEGLKSIVVLTVHDSVLVDVYPGERDAVAKVVKEGLLDLNTMCQEFYDFEFDYPLDVDVKAGPDWLNCKELDI